MSFTGIWALRQFGETGPKYPKSCVETQKVIQSFQHCVSHWMRSYSSVKAIWGSTYTCFRVYGISGDFWGTGPQCPDIPKLINFIILTYWVSNFLFRMGSINCFGQVVQEILLNNYLKSNFENLEIRDFVPTFWNFIMEKSSIKNHLFFEL